jgi:hypothetical protein
MKHLNDEHMQLYEWSGAGAGIAFSMPAKSSRTHPWHASCAVLSVLTSLLILNGCNSNTSAPTSEQAALEPRKDQASPSDVTTTQPAPGEAAAPAVSGEAGATSVDTQQP